MIACILLFIVVMLMGYGVAHPPKHHRPAHTIPAWETQSRQEHACLYQPSSVGEMCERIVNDI